MTDMPPNVDTTTRLAELLCPEHCRRAVTVWPVAGGWGDLNAVCEDCNERYRAWLGGDSDRRLRPLPTMDPTTRREFDAFHEAGHAVVGAITTGRTLRYVEVEERWNAELELWQSGEARFCDGQAFVVGNLTMKWAGLMASLTWLNEVELGDVENRVDACILAWVDRMSAAEIAAQHNLGEFTGRVQARWMVRDMWPAIVTVARNLTISGRLSGAEVSHLINTPRITPRTRNAPSAGDLRNPKESVRLAA